MEMSNWLDGKPFIRNGLMLSYNYNYQTDDSETAIVHTYPDCKYIGKFITSRFCDTHIFERYPQPNADGFFNVGEFTIYRELFSNIDKNSERQWLERIQWGHPDLVLPNGERNTEIIFSVISGEPKPFEEIVEHILKYQTYGN